MIPDRVVMWVDDTSGDPAWVVSVEYGPAADPTSNETVSIVDIDDTASALDFAREYAAALGVPLMRIGRAR